MIDKGARVAVTGLVGAAQFNGNFDIILGLFSRISQRYIAMSPRARRVTYATGPNPMPIANWMPIGALFLFFGGGCSQSDGVPDPRLQVMAAVNMAMVNLPTSSLFLAIFEHHFPQKNPPRCLSPLFRPLKRCAHAVPSLERTEPGAYQACYWTCCVMCST